MKTTLLTIFCVLILSGFKVNPKNSRTFFADSELIVTNVTTNTTINNITMTWTNLSGPQVLSFSVSIPPHGSYSIPCGNMNYSTTVTLALSNTISGILQVRSPEPDVPWNACQAFSSKNNPSITFQLYHPCYLTIRNGNFTC